MATSSRSWIKSARSASKKSGIRSAPRRLRLVSNHCDIGHLADDLNRSGNLWAGKPMLRFLLRFLGLACLISQGHVMTNNALIYRRPSKWPIAAALTAPRPDYPYEARSRHITGSGIAVIAVDPNSGLAVDAMMEQSIGNPILDNSTVSAFRRWRFKPGTPRRVRIPITFVLTGAQY